MNFRKAPFIFILFIVISSLIAFHSCTKTNTKPEAEITQPHDNTVFTVGDIIQIKTHHQDDEGNIARCNLMIDDLSIFMSEPGVNSYSLNTENMRAGRYVIKLYVEDTEGFSDNDSIHIIIQNPPVVSQAKFSANKTSGITPLTVCFTDSSTNNPKIWIWDFGDGTTSEEQNPQHTYTTEGVYSVTLQAGVDAIGEPCSMNDLITVYPQLAPVAGFIASPLTGEVPLEVSFQDTSLNHPSQWFWDFGDGTYSTEQNPVKTYTQPGAYYVALDIMNKVGSDRKVYNRYIQVNDVPQPLVAGIHIPLVSGEINTEIAFFDASENNPEFWEWNFGDGNKSRDQNPTHVYYAPGNYTVSLTAYNIHDSSSLSIANAVTIYGPCPDAPEVVDIDGNQYKTVQVGEQCWMAENLKVTTYPDGTEIPRIESTSSWENLGNTNEDDAYCYYQNDSTFGYGALYTFGAATAKGWAHQNQPLQGICPDGWHIPTNQEWKTLEGVADTQFYPGHSDFDRSERWRGFDVGKQLKSTDGWYTRNNGDNRSGFTALPGGIRKENGEFFIHEFECSFWTGTEYYNERAEMRKLSYDNEGSWRTTLKRSHGLAVRCIKNIN